DNRENENRLFGAYSIDDDAPNQQCKNCRDAVGGVQPAEKRSRISEVLDEDPLEGIYAVINVVVATHGDTNQNQHNPSVQSGRFRAHGFRHEDSFGRSQFGPLDFGSTEDSRLQSRSTEKTNGGMDSLDG